MCDQENSLYTQDNYKNILFLSKTLVGSTNSQLLKSKKYIRRWSESDIQCLLFNFNESNKTHATNLRHMPGSSTNVHEIITSKERTSEKDRRMDLCRHINKGYECRFNIDCLFHGTRLTISSKVTPYQEITCGNKTENYLKNQNKNLQDKTFLPTHKMSFNKNDLPNCRTVVDKNEKEGNINFDQVSKEERVKSDYKTGNNRYLVKVELGHDCKGSKELCIATNFPQQLAETIENREGPFLRADMVFDIHLSNMGQANLIFHNSANIANTKESYLALDNRNYGGSSSKSPSKDDVNMKKYHQLDHNIISSDNIKSKIDKKTEAVESLNCIIKETSEMFSANPNEKMYAKKNLKDIAEELPIVSEILNSSTEQDGKRNYKCNSLKKSYEIKSQELTQDFTFKNDGLVIFDTEEESKNLMENMLEISKHDNKSKSRPIDNPQNVTIKDRDYALNKGINTKSPEIIIEVYEHEKAKSLLLDTQEKSKNYEPTTNLIILPEFDMINDKRMSLKEEVHLTSETSQEKVSILEKDNQRTLVTKELLKNKTENSWKTSSHENKHKDNSVILPELDVINETNMSLKKETEISFEKSKPKVSILENDNKGIISTKKWSKLETENSLKILRHSDSSIIKLPLDITKEKGNITTKEADSITENSVKTSRHDIEPKGNSIILSEFEVINEKGMSLEKGTEITSEKSKQKVSILENDNKGIISTNKRSKLETENSVKTSRHDNEPKGNSIILSEVEVINEKEILFEKETEIPYENQKQENSIMEKDNQRKFVTDELFKIKLESSMKTSRHENEPKGNPIILSEFELINEKEMSLEKGIASEKSKTHEKPKLDEELKSNLVILPDFDVTNEKNVSLEKETGIASEKFKKEDCILHKDNQGKFITEEWSGTKIENSVDITDLDEEPKTNHEILPEFVVINERNMSLERKIDIKSERSKTEKDTKGIINTEKWSKIKTENSLKILRHSDSSIIKLPLNITKEKGNITTKEADSISSESKIEVYINENTDSWIFGTQKNSKNEDQYKPNVISELYILNEKDKLVMNERKNISEESIKEVFSLENDDNEILGKKENCIKEDEFLLEISRKDHEPKSNIIFPTEFDLIKDKDSIVKKELDIKSPESKIEAYTIEMADSWILGTQEKFINEIEYIFDILKNDDEPNTNPNVILELNLTKDKDKFVKNERELISEELRDEVLILENDDSVIFGKEKSVENKTENTLKISKKDEVAKPISIIISESNIKDDKDNSVNKEIFVLEKDNNGILSREERIRNKIENSVEIPGDYDETKINPIIIPEFDIINDEDKSVKKEIEIRFRESISEVFLIAKDDKDILDIPRNVDQPNEEIFDVSQLYQPFNQPIDDGSTIRDKISLLKNMVQENQTLDKKPSSEKNIIIKESSYIYIKNNLKNGKLTVEQRNNFEKDPTSVVEKLRSSNEINEFDNNYTLKVDSPICDTLEIGDDVVDSGRLDKLTKDLSTSDQLPKIVNSFPSHSINLTNNVSDNVDILKNSEGKPIKVSSEPLKDPILSESKENASTVDVQLMKMNKELDEKKSFEYTQSISKPFSIKLESLRKKHQENRTNKGHSNKIDDSQILNDPISSQEILYFEKPLVVALEEQSLEDKEAAMKVNIPEMSSGLSSDRKYCDNIVALSLNQECEINSESIDIKRKTSSIVEKVSSKEINPVLVPSSISLIETALVLNQKLSLQNQIVDELIENNFTIKGNDSLTFSGKIRSVSITRDNIVGSLKVLSIQISKEDIPLMNFNLVSGLDPEKSLVSKTSHLINSHSESMLRHTMNDKEANVLIVSLEKEDVKRMIMEDTHAEEKTSTLKSKKEITLSKHSKDISMKKEFSNTDLTDDTQLELNDEIFKNVSLSLVVQNDNLSKNKNDIIIDETIDKNSENLNFKKKSSIRKESFKDENNLERNRNIRSATLSLSTLEIQYAPLQYDEEHICNDESINNGLLVWENKVEETEKEIFILKKITSKTSNISIQNEDSSRLRNDIQRKELSNSKDIIQYKNESLINVENSKLNTNLSTENKMKNSNISLQNEDSSHITNDIKSKDMSIITVENSKPNSNLSTENKMINSKIEKVIEINEYIEYKDNLFDIRPSLKKLSTTEKEVINNDSITSCKDNSLKPKDISLKNVYNVEDLKVESSYLLHEKKYKSEEKEQAFEESLINKIETVQSLDILDHDNVIVIEDSYIAKTLSLKKELDFTKECDIVELIIPNVDIKVQVTDKVTLLEEKKREFINTDKEITHTKSNEIIIEENKIFTTKSSVKNQSSLFSIDNTTVTPKEKVISLNEKNNLSSKSQTLELHDGSWKMCTTDTLGMVFSEEIYDNDKSQKIELLKIGEFDELKFLSVDKEEILNDEFLKDKKEDFLIQEKPQKKEQDSVKKDSQSQIKTELFSVSKKSVFTDKIGAVIMNKPIINFSPLPVVNTKNIATSQLVYNETNQVQTYLEDILINNIVSEEKKIKKKSHNERDYKEIEEKNEDPIDEHVENIISIIDNESIDIMTKSKSKDSSTNDLDNQTEMSKEDDMEMDYPNNCPNITQEEVNKCESKETLLLKGEVKNDDQLGFNKENLQGEIIPCLIEKISNVSDIEVKNKQEIKTSFKNGSLTQSVFEVENQKSNLEKMEVKSKLSKENKVVSEETLIRVENISINESKQVIGKEILNEDEYFRECFSVQERHHSYLPIKHVKSGLLSDKISLIEIHKKVSQENIIENKVELGFDLKEPRKSDIVKERIAFSEHASLITTVSQIDKVNIIDKPNSIPLELVLSTTNDTTVTDIFDSKNKWSEGFDTLNIEKEEILYSKQKLPDKITKVSYQNENEEVPGSPQIVNLSTIQEYKYNDSDLQSKTSRHPQDCNAKLSTNLVSETVEEIQIIEIKKELKHNNEIKNKESQNLEENEVSFTQNSKHSIKALNIASNEREITNRISIKKFSALEPISKVEETIPIEKGLNSIIWKEPRLSDEDLIFLDNKPFNLTALNIIEKDYEVSNAVSKDDKTVHSNVLCEEVLKDEIGKRQVSKDLSTTIKEFGNDNLIIRPQSIFLLEKVKNSETFMLSIKVDIMQDKISDLSNNKKRTVEENDKICHQILPGNVESELKSQILNPDNGNSTCKNEIKSNLIVENIDINLMEKTEEIELKTKSNYKVEFTESLENKILISKHLHENILEEEVSKMLSLETLDISTKETNNEKLEEDIKKDNISLNKFDSSKLVEQSLKKPLLSDKDFNSLHDISSKSKPPRFIKNNFKATTKELLYNEISKESKTVSTVKMDSLSQNETKLNSILVHKNVIKDNLNPDQIREQNFLESEVPKSENIDKLLSIKEIKVSNSEIKEIEHYKSNEESEIKNTFSIPNINDMKKPEASVINEPKILYNTSYDAKKEVPFSGEIIHLKEEKSTQKETLLSKNKSILISGSEIVIPANESLIELTESLSKDLSERTKLLKVSEKPQNLYVPKILNCKPFRAFPITIDYTNVPCLSINFVFNQCPENINSMNMSFNEIGVVENLTERISRNIVIPEEDYEAGKEIEKPNTMHSREHHEALEEQYAEQINIVLGNVTAEMYVNITISNSSIMKDMTKNEFKDNTEIRC